MRYSVSEIEAQFLSATTMRVYLIMVTLMATPNLIDSILKVIGPAAKMAFIFCMSMATAQPDISKIFGKASKEHGSWSYVF